MPSAWTLDPRPYILASFRDLSLCSGLAVAECALEDPRDLAHGGGTEQGGDDDPDERQHPCDLLDDLREELVGRDPHHRRHQHHLEGGECQALRAPRVLTQLLLRS